MASPFPKSKKRLKTKLERCKAVLRSEKQRFGGYDDSAGLQYLLGPTVLNGCRLTVNLWVKNSSSFCTDKLLTGNRRLLGRLCQTLEYCGLIRHS